MHWHAVYDADARTDSGCNVPGLPPATAAAGSRGHPSHGDSDRRASARQERPGACTDPKPAEPHFQRKLQCRCSIAQVRAHWHWQGLGHARGLGEAQMWSLPASLLTRSTAMDMCTRALLIICDSYPARLQSPKISSSDSERSNSRANTNHWQLSCHPAAIEEILNKSAEV